MALIKCVDCGTEVSDQAAACPKCARPLVEKKKGEWTFTGLILAGVGALLFFTGIGGFYGMMGGMLGMLGGGAMFVVSWIQK